MSEPFYEFFCPVKVIAGNRAIEHIPFELSARGASRPLVITDAGVRGAGLIDPLIAALSDADVEPAAIYDDVPPDSSTRVVSLIAEKYRALACDAFVAVGGGSVIDTSKGVNILVSEGGDDLAAFTGVEMLDRPLRPLFIIPTTAGTGSEVTGVAVITDEMQNLKLPFTSRFLLPDVAVLDPRMTLTLPPALTAATAMDAFTHATEAFICLAKNPLSDAYAVAAIRMIAENLMKVMDDPGDVQGRLALAQASTLAGIAFTNSMVGLVHSLGHALGAVCHVPHGVCMNVFLVPVLRYNLDTCGETIGELLLPLGGADVYAATPPTRRPAKTIELIRELQDQLHQRCGLARTLSETGQVRRDQLRAVAEVTLDEGAIIFNPVEVSRDDAIAVLENAW